MSNDKSKAKVSQTKRVKTHASDTRKYLDIFNQKEGVAYRFVRRDPMDINKRKMDGWEVVHDDQIMGPKHDGSSEIGTHDLVLMENSHEKVDELRQRPIEKSRRDIEGTTRATNSLDTTTISKEYLRNGTEDDTIFE